MVINFKKKNIFSIILFILLCEILFLGMQLFLLKILNVEKEVARAIFYVIKIIFLTSMLKVINKREIIKWDKNNFINGLKIGTPLLIYCIIFALFSILSTDSFKLNSPMHIIYWFLVYLVGAGFIEELEARGYIINMFDDYKRLNNKKNIISACMLSAILFGSLHILNVLGSGEIPVAQMIMATGLGLVLSAIYIRSKSLWAVACIHGIWDISLSIDNILFINEITNKTTVNSSSKIIFAVIMIIPLILIFLFMMRKKKIDEFLLEQSK